MVTGGAGFIGYHCELSLLKSNNKIICLDNLNDYYSPDLKNKRLDLLKKDDNFIFEYVDIRNKTEVLQIVKKYKPDIVIHLAAQAGVRFSFHNPDIYISTNIVGFFNVLDCCRETGLKNIIFTSSSSVYGNNTNKYFNESDPTDHPESIYAATKKADEEIAFAMAKNYGLNIVGLRLFTVYGPFGRPDMAYYSFADAIRTKSKIQVFNYGNVYRDYTYVEDVAYAIKKLVEKLTNSFLPCNFEIINIAHGKEYSVNQMINYLEEEFKTSIEKEYVEKKIGDVDRTQANTQKLYSLIGVKPKTDLQTGIKRFSKWYKDFYGM